MDRSLLSRSTTSDWKALLLGAASSTLLLFACFIFSEGGPATVALADTIVTLIAA